MTCGLLLFSGVFSMSSEAPSDPAAELSSIEADAKKSLAECATTQDLVRWNSTYLGEKGSVTLQARKVGGLPKEQRPAFGQAFNRVKNDLAGLHEARQGELKRVDLER